jgi:hypothetical protein
MVLGCVGSVEDCSRAILQEAMRDQLNGVGRVFISELMRRGFSRDTITDALRSLSSRYRIVVVGDVIKVYFSTRAR